MPADSDNLSSIALNHILRELEGLKTDIAKVESVVTKVAGVEILIAERSSAIDRAFSEISINRAGVNALEVRIRALENEQGLMKLVRRMVISAVIGIIAMVGLQAWQLLQAAPRAIADQHLRPTVPGSR